MLYYSLSFLDLWPSTLLTSQGSVVGDIVAQFLAVARDILFPGMSRPSLKNIQLPTLWVWGTLSPGLKHPGSEVDRSSSLIWV